MQCDPAVASVEDGLLKQPDTQALQGKILPYSIYHIDRAARTGVDIHNGELIVVQGPEKNRKTTMVLNMVRFWSKVGIPGGGNILVETLESSMTRQKYKQSLLVMEATGYILAQHYGIENGRVQLPYRGDPKYKVADMGAIYNDLGHELKMSVDFARVSYRSKLQQQAIEYAVEAVDSWPLLIYGAASAEGHTRAIRTNGKVLDFRTELPYVRWKRAIEEMGVRIIVLDHVQGYAGPGGMAYQMLDEITNRISTIVAELKVVVVAVSQVSLGSMRDDTMGLYARGGKRLAEEANRVFSTKYEDRQAHMIIESTASRGEPPPTIIQRMDMHSGKFIGRSVPQRTYVNA
jgi:hypothetical protein